jgi:hypothetical protein
MYFYRDELLQFYYMPRLPYIIEKLKQAFEPYKPFWDDWKKYRYNLLTRREIHLVNALIEKDFQLSFEDQSIFYFNHHLLNQIIKKFNESLPEFNEWLILRFQFRLLVLIPEGKTLHPFSSAINDLHLPKPIKNCLYKFNCYSIYGIIWTYTEKQFKQATVLKQIAKFLALFAQHLTITKARKGVLSTGDAD